MLPNFLAQVSSFHVALYVDVLSLGDSPPFYKEARLSLAKSSWADPLEEELTVPG